MAEADYAGRLERTRESMRAAGVDGLLVTSAVNRRYLTGYPAADGDFTESAGWVVVTDASLDLLAGSSALSGLEDEIRPSGATILRTDGTTYAAVAAERVSALGVRRLGFEEQWLSYYRYTRLAQALQPNRIAAVPLSDLVQLVRARKDAAEIAIMRRAGEIADRAFALLMEQVRLSMTERELAATLDRLMIDLGAEGPSFETIVACGPGGETPHAVPRDRELRPGEPLLIDFGCRVDGYCSDLTRTVCIGEAPSTLVEVYTTVRAAQDAAMAALAHGARRGRDLDTAARKTITEAEYGAQFLHSLGHGLGMAVHELPALGWLRVQTPEADAELSAIEHLEPGVVVTNEPGIYLPGWGGVRLEDDLLVTEHGGESLAPRNPEQILCIPARP